jgi:outer membrane murein-binding lipoprotein Lpp
MSDKKKKQKDEQEHEEPKTESQDDLKQRLLLENQKFREASEEVETLKSQIEELEKNVNGVPQDKIALEVNSTKSKLKSALHKYRKCYFYALVGNRIRLTSVLQMTSSGRSPAIRTDTNPDGFTLEELGEAATMKKEIEANAAPEIVEQIHTSEETEKDLKSEIVKLQEKIQQEQKSRELIVEQAYEQAPMWVWLKYPKLTSQLWGEAVVMTTTTSKPTVTNTGAGRRSTAAPEITEENILRAVQEKPGMGNKEICEKLNIIADTTNTNAVYRKGRDMVAKGVLITQNGKLYPA